MLFWQCIIYLTNLSASIIRFILNFHQKRINSSINLFPKGWYITLTGRFRSGEVEFSDKSGKTTQLSFDHTEKVVQYSYGTSVGHQFLPFKNSGFVVDVSTGILIDQTQSTRTYSNPLVNNAEFNKAFPGYNAKKQFFMDGSPFTFSIYLGYAF